MRDEGAPRPRRTPTEDQSYINMDPKVPRRAPVQLVPKVVSCLQTVGNTISSTSVSRGVFYGPGHQLLSLLMELSMTGFG